MMLIKPWWLEVWTVAALSIVLVLIRTPLYRIPLPAKRIERTQVATRGELDTTNCRDVSGRAAAETNPTGDLLTAESRTAVALIESWLKLAASVADANDADWAEARKHMEYASAVKSSQHGCDVSGQPMMLRLHVAKYGPFSNVVLLSDHITPLDRYSCHELRSHAVERYPALWFPENVCTYVTTLSRPPFSSAVADAFHAFEIYRPLLMRIFAEEAVPTELIFISVALSGLDTRLYTTSEEFQLKNIPDYRTSRMGAWSEWPLERQPGLVRAGMWQFTTQRGREYGLTQTVFSDDRLDPERASRSAARHLRDLFNHFGDWPLAIAAYLTGSDLIDEAVQSTGYADYNYLSTRVPQLGATTKYLTLMSALAIVAAESAPSPDRAWEWEYATIWLESPTSLHLASDITGHSIDELLELNPSLLGSVAPAGFGFRIPRGTQDLLSAGLSAIPPEYRERWRLYKSRNGDDLNRIAWMFGVSIDALVRVNRTTSPLQPGTLLAIPIERSQSLQRAGTADK
jgi:hypothetical protein